jgi:hypothetical protein
MVSLCATLADKVERLLLAAAIIFAALLNCHSSP